MRVFGEAFFIKRFKMGPPGFEPGSVTPEATSIAKLAHGPKIKELLKFNKMFLIKSDKEY